MAAVSHSRPTAISAKTLLERNSLFRDLPSTTIDQIATLATRRSYKKGAVVFMRGDPGDALYGVATGKVRISTSAAGGREIFLNDMVPGATFGEIALLDGHARTASATTLAPTELIIVQRQQFQSLLLREPALSVHLLELLCQRVRWTSEQMEDSSLLDAPTRLAKRLLALAHSQPKMQISGTPIKTSQEEMARFIGVSRQIVNKHLQVWKKKQWIALGRGTVLVKDATALQQVASGE
jgi:CRP-like cAMP-binding protein